MKPKRTQFAQHFTLLCVIFLLNLGNVFAQGSIGNYVWFDTNGNGLQDEPITNGINGVSVELWNAGADKLPHTADDALLTTTTTANNLSGESGYYLFSGLARGFYYVKFPLNTGKYTLTVANNVPNTNGNSDVNTFFGVSPIVEINTGDLALPLNNATIDAGYTRYPALLANPCYKQDTIIYSKISNEMVFDILDDTMRLPKFDNSLGELVKVDVESRMVIKFLYRLRNLGSQPRAITYTNSDTAWVTGPGTNNPNTIIFPQQTILATTLAPSQTVRDTLIFGDQCVYNETFAVAPYIGNDSLVYVANAVANTQLIASGTFDRLNITSAIYAVSVRYIYSRPVCSQVGDYVWLDLNKNGIQDTNEKGVSGVTVTLYDANNVPVATTLTDASGHYLFETVLPGSYSVRFTLPIEYEFTTANAGGDDTKDSDATTDGFTQTFTIGELDQNLTLDAGLVFKNKDIANLGNFVWIDGNANGLQDVGEPGVAKVAVSLLNTSNTVLQTTYTNEKGEYYFSDLPAGTYRVLVTLPSGFTFTTQNVGTNSDIDSDVDVNSGVSSNISLSLGQNDFSWDAGLVLQGDSVGSVGDFVWLDANANGIQDENESGIGGIRVNLLDVNNNVVASTITNLAGGYIFTDVTPGIYSVQFIYPATYLPAPINAGANDEKDSDIGLIGVTDIFNVNPGDRITSIDAGLVLATPPGTSGLGDYVWLDANNNGTQDVGEIGVQGVTVYLLNAAGTTILSRTTTDETGFYSFLNLKDDTYRVQFTNLPLGTSFTQKNVGPTDTDSDADATTGITDVITLPIATYDSTIDAGLILAVIELGKGSIGDYVWNDLDQDGIQDANEPGVANVVVTLTNVANTFTATTRTDAEGKYIFNGLDPDTYVVTFTLPSGYSFSPNQQGTNPAKDSDADIVTGKSEPIDLGEGETNTTVDAGIFKNTPNLGSIGNFVWYDLNGNGQQASNEPGVPGVTVILYDIFNDVVGQTITNENGFYLFPDLVAGDYKVLFTNLPDGYTFTTQNAGSDLLDSNPDVLTGLSGTITLPANTDNLTIDAGIVSVRGALGDYVWFDTDKDGIQDATESPLPGVTAILLDNAGNVLANAITDDKGYYFFPNLPAGTYAVKFDALPEGTTFTLKDASGNTQDALDSDVNALSATTDAVTLAAGQVKPTVDAGVKAKVPASLKGIVWFDADLDGLRDATEKPTPGVLVTLYDNLGNPIVSTVTGPDGVYFFDNLLPGTYNAVFSNKPLGTNFTLANVNANANDNLDSDADPITGNAGNVTLNEGDNIAGPDAGLIPSASLRGRAWSDNNGSGTQNAGEVGITGVRVRLFDANDNLLRTTETGADGRYEFTNLFPFKEYYVVFDTIPLRKFTGQDVGPDNLDSDVYNDATATPSNPLGATKVLAPLAPSEDRKFNDAGYLVIGGTFPVELLFFNAELMGNDTRLKWATTQEINSDYFVVERSLDGRAYGVVGTIDAAGNSNQTLSYNMMDYKVTDLGVRKLYYRLRMIDIDGTEKLSDVVEVSLNKKSDLYVNFYPNPVANNLTLEYNLFGVNYGQIRILNALGQEVWMRNITSQKELQVMDVDVSTWSKGMYFIETSTDQSITTSKFIVQ